MPRPDGLDGLPVELLRGLCAFLVGGDVLALAMTRRRLHEVITADAGIWRSRLLPLPGPTAATAASAYLDDHSLLFPGQDARASTRGERGACVTIPTTTVDAHGVPRSLPLAPVARDALTFDLWFSLRGEADDGASDEDDEEEEEEEEDRPLTGGILLGAQSVQWKHTMVWAHYHQQLCYVDPQRTLYCSVTDDKLMVARDLETRRWYHLALSYSDHEQRIYLDGRLVARSPGGLHREWTRLEHVQLGTGCISGSTPGKPSTTFCGWYAFHGLVDEFRLWERGLGDEEIAWLAQGQAPGLGALAPMYSLRALDRPNLCGRMQYVHCARPLERRWTTLWCSRRHGSAGNLKTISDDNDMTPFEAFLTLVWPEWMGGGASTTPTTTKTTKPHAGYRKTVKRSRSRRRWFFGLRW